MGAVFSSTTSDALSGDSGNTYARSYVSGAFAAAAAAAYFNAANVAATAVQGVSPGGKGAEDEEKRKHWPSKCKLPQRLTTAQKSPRTDDIYAAAIGSVGGTVQSVAIPRRIIT